MCRIKRGTAAFAVAVFVLLFGPAVAQTQEQAQPWGGPFSLGDGAYITSSPALSPDERTIYIGVEYPRYGGVAAIARDGSKRWTVNLLDSVVVTAAVGGDGTVYIGSDDGTFYAFAGDTGEELWKVDKGAFVGSSPAIAEDGTVYFAVESTLYAVTRGGQDKWAFEVGGWIKSSPAIGADGTIYFGSNDGFLHAVNPDGTPKWQFAMGGQILTSPAIGSDGTIYIGSTNQNLYAVTPEGGLKWQRFTNGEIQASPVLGADGTVYFASFDTLFYALSPATGAIKWTTPFQATSAAPAAVRADGVIIFGADDGILRALNPDGSLRWTFDTLPEAGEFIESAPLIAPDGAIYFSSLNGNLYKLNGNGSPLSTVSSWPVFRRGERRNGRAEKTGTGGRLVNLSTRAAVAAGEDIIVGFYAAGGAEQPVHLVRAVGPTLAEFGVDAFMPNPRIQLFSGTNPVLGGANDDWETPLAGFAFNFGARETFEGVGAFPLRAGSKDAAVILPLPPGPYTANVRSADNVGGVVLAEVYSNIGENPPRLVNLSARNRVGAGEEALIAGFVVGGTEPTRLLLRGVGPGLAPFGVVDFLPRLRLSLFSHPTETSPQRLPRTNDNWTAGGIGHDLAMAAELAGAFPLLPGSADAAVVAVVGPGAYTIQISGLNGATGEALAEIYVLP